MSHKEEHDIERRWGENEEELGSVQHALEAFQDIAYLPDYIEHFEALSVEEWRGIGSNPKEAFRKLKRETETAKLDYEQQTNLVQRTFKNYIDCLEMTNNLKVKKYANQLMRMLDGGKLYDYEYIDG